MTRAPHQPLAIVQVGTSDEGGGAATVAVSLGRRYRARGHHVTHVVGRSRGDDPSVVVLPDEDRPVFRGLGYVAIQRALSRLAARHPDRGLGLAGRTLRLLTHPRAAVGKLQGIEDFEFPASHRLLDLAGGRADLVHLHNLHGGFFDLRALPAISARVPTFVTLHDMWLLTGHCAHALGCDRWQAGCGRCPDLGLDPAVRRDATDVNWQRKRDVFASSRLHVATPSRWLRDLVARSMLAPFGEARVIPNGVDESVFRPADRAAVRASLGLPLDVPVVLLTTGSRGSMWKDDHTLRQAMARLTDRMSDGAPLFVAVGRESAVRDAGRARTRSIPFERDQPSMARYYQAADVYLHAARADTCPLAVLEAMACGTPVVATATGGIPEQIRAGVTGMLVPMGGWQEMADATEALLGPGGAAARMGAEARRDVEARFTLARQADAYLAWFEDVLAGAPHAAGAAASRLAVV